MSYLLARTKSKMVWLLQSKRIAFTKLLVATGLFGLTFSIFANPVLDNVASCNINIQSAPNTLNVYQSSQQGIVNWQSFNIQKGEATHFYQPTGGITLNRISPLQGASQIYGTL